MKIAISIPPPSPGPVPMGSSPRLIYRGASLIQIKSVYVVLCASVNTFIGIFFFDSDTAMTARLVCDNARDAALAAFSLSKGLHDTAATTRKVWRVKMFAIVQRQYF